MFAIRFALVCAGVGLLVVLAARSGLSEDQGTPRTASPKEAIESLAANKAAPGTPQYNAALRGALGLAAASYAVPGGGFDLTRAVKLPSPASMQVPPVTRVDADSRYGEWLRQHSDAPVVELNLADCTKVDARVVGGTRIKNPRCFSDVALAFETATKPFCSAVLIKNRHIMLTAGHCVCDASMEYAVFGLDLTSPHSYRVPIVDRRLHDGIKCPGPDVTEAESQASAAGRDMAGLRLFKDVPADVAQPRDLPYPGIALQLYNSGVKTLVVAGFGFTEASPDTPQWVVDRKQKTFGLTGIISPDCAGSEGGRPDADSYGCVPGKEILAVDPRLVGPCAGDSGGGAYMLAERAGSKLPILVGLNSRSVLDHTAPCGDGAIYTLLDAEAVSWIENTTAGW